MMKDLYCYRAIIKRIIDGDTFVVDIDCGFRNWIIGEKIRLYGINTPEIRTKDKEEKAKGLISKAEVVKMLPNNTEIIIQTYIDKNKDGFGRILATVWKGELNINDWLVERGLAKIDNGRKKEV